MTSRPPDLPDFSNPPVVETVLSVQFDRLAALRTVHFGLYWNEVRSRFPKSEERPELPPIDERFPPPPRPAVGIQFEAFENPPIPRFWFIDAGGTELIQVQRDRFIKNWRKVGEGDEYPRYESVKEGFERDFADYREFIARNELGTVRINQCEVTYINHIVAGAGWTTYSDIEKVFTVWRQPVGTHPGCAEGLSFRAQFPILGQGGVFIGRLYASLQSAQRLQDGVPMFVLELTARGILGDNTDFFNIGREWIVRSFKELTTAEMHRIWGLRS